MLKIEKTEVVGWEAAIRGMRNPLESWARSDSEYKCPYKEPGAPICSNCTENICLGANDHDLMTRLREAGTDHRKFMRFLDVYVDITAPLYWWKEFKTYRAGRAFGDDEPDICPIPDEYLEFDIEMNSCSTMHKIHSKEFALEDFSHEHLIDYELYSCNEVDGPVINGAPHIGCGGIQLLHLTINVLNYYRRKYLEIGEKLRQDITREQMLELKAVQKQYWWQMIQLLPSSYNQKRTLKLTYEVLTNMYKSRRNHKLDEWHTFCDWIESLPYSELITGSIGKKVVTNEDGRRDNGIMGIKAGPYISQAPANCDIEKSEE